MIECVCAFLGKWDGLRIGGWFGGEDWEGWCGGRENGCADWLLGHALTRECHYRLPVLRNVGRGQDADPVAGEEDQ